MLREASNWFDQYNITANVASVIKDLHQRAQKTVARSQLPLPLALNSPRDDGWDVQIDNFNEDLSQYTLEKSERSATQLPVNFRFFMVRPKIKEPTKAEKAANK